MQVDRVVLCAIVVVSSFGSIVGILYATFLRANVAYEDAAHL